MQDRSEPFDPIAPAGLLQAITDPVYAVDDDWSIVYSNAAAARAFGAPEPAALLGRSLWDAVPGRRMGSVFEDALRAAMATGRSRTVSSHVPQLDGTFQVRAYPHPGGLVVAFNDISSLKAQEERLARLAEERERVARVAHAVAADRPTDEVFALIAEEGRRLGRAQLGAITRFEPGGDGAIVVGSAGGRLPAADDVFSPGATVTLTPGGAAEHVRRTARTLTVSDYAEHGRQGIIAALGYRAAVFVPILVAGRVWGMTTFAATEPWPDADEIVPAVERFAELAALAIQGTEARAELALRATTDPLTGLLNRRAFQERMAAEIARARRHGGALCLVSLDVDDFKGVNDAYGHDAGDAALRVVADELRRLCRSEDVAARLGGDEFAVLLVGTERAGALAAVERTRQRLAATALLDGVRIRVSAGICDWQPDRDPATMLRLADDALYWAKANGRDAAWLYDADIVHHFDLDTRRDLLERGQALTGLRALARAIDAKDTATREHSERVAELGRELAERLGWDEQRAALLHEAGLVHDVGKIGVPDAVLLKPGRLTADEYAQVKGHAALGAEIAEGVLTSEQVSWIRSHHERPDGGGYPDALTGDEIPDGAAILAVADCWDAMTAARSYSEPMEPGRALAECRRLAGRQFRPDVVEALAGVVLRALVGTGDPASVGWTAAPSAEPRAAEPLAQVRQRSG